MVYFNLARPILALKITLWYRFYDPNADLLFPSSLVLDKKANTCFLVRKKSQSRSEKRLSVEICQGLSTILAVPCLTTSEVMYSHPEVDRIWGICGIY